MTVLTEWCIIYEIKIYKVGVKMINEKCLLKWHIDNIRSKNQDLCETEVLNRARTNTLRQCKLFPSFPDMDLIIGISGQRYEKMDCYSNMVFLPQQYQGKIHMDTEYENAIPLSENKLRTIRKLLESVDTSHCLVFQKGEDGKHQAIGTTAISEISSKLITLIEIRGHMVWRAYISSLPIFEYKNGTYFPITEKFNENDFKEAMYTTFGKALQTAGNSKEIVENWVRLVSYVSNSNHGTSIVILGSNYDDEVKRLTNPKSGHGIKLKKQIGFASEANIEKYLSQVTRIDGGLLLNINGMCRAIGCIFDGVVFEEFEGDSGRGSRFNSVKLYVKQHTQAGFECMGIIVSDDGTVDIISR